MLESQAIPEHKGYVGAMLAPMGLDPGAIFEADLEDCAYGYRPQRSALDAVQLTHRLIRRGYTDVVDADLSKYFDSVDHGLLMRMLAHRIADPRVLRLIER